MADNAAVGGPIYRGAARYAKPLFVLTILTGSFLLFLVQPMIARMALPRLGGAPNVWNSAMLVYQALLLAGYAYAHRISGLGPRIQTGLHMALLLIAAFWLPVGLMMLQPPQGEAVFLWVLWLLVASIGPLFFIVSAQAPLMQRWYAMTDRGSEPYALYAASNLGSFSGLLAYPLLVEPNLSIAMQQVLWTGLYLFLLCLVTACAIVTMRQGKGQGVRHEAVTESETLSEPRPDLKRCITWIVLAFVPSGLMLSTTTHLTTDLIAMPLIWVIPLGLYLLSFTVAFMSYRRIADAITWIAPFVILVCAAGAFMAEGSTSVLAAAASLVMLFVVATALHTHMYRMRPAPEHLTLFYLMMSVGGVLGGVFCALAAPLIFDWIYEHPILVALAALLAPQTMILKPAAVTEISERARKIVYFTIGATALTLSYALYTTLGLPQDGPGYFALTALGCAGLLAMGRRYAFAACVAAVMLANGGWANINQSAEGSRTRSYFGVYTVTDYPSENIRRLAHGTTMHGMQYLDEERQTQPTSYYGRQSGVGLALSSAASDAKIAVVGLGTGTLGCYRTGVQQWHFFEIDPAMADIARDRSKFTYLSKCAPDARIHIGDARLKLDERNKAEFDILVIDAFSSDAIPMHLLTHEAFDIYDAALAEDGLLVIHISNRYVDLRPVLAAESEKRGWPAAERFYDGDYLNSETGEAPSSWVAFARDENRLVRLTDGVATGETSGNNDGQIWQRLAAKPGFAGWTDDYGSVLPLLKFQKGN